MRYWKPIIVILLLFQGCAPRAIQASGEVITAPVSGSAPTQAQVATSTARPSPSATATRWIQTPTHALPTPSVQATPLPIQPTATLLIKAEVKGMSGYGQVLPLTCESRAAADWARHFGVIIHELDFTSRLPKSTNPDQGFVGSPNGGWGNIPPEAYGVHAGPVAKLLRDYGLRGARAIKGMTLDKLRTELSAGRPVIVWVTGHVEAGKGVQIQIDGQAITVARYEHTVIAIGYDEKTISILDGKTIYKRPVDTFLKSWGALGNMAIYWEETSGFELPFELMRN